MTDTTTPPTSEPAGVVLSREELLVILSLTGRTFPELSNEPIADLTDAQRAYGLIVAERALRARQVAILDEQGNTRIDRNVLRLVLGCTTNGNKVIVTRVDPATALAIQASAHFFEDEWILHSQPFAGIHAFQEAGEWATAWPTLIGFVNYPTAPAPELLSLTVPNAVVGQAREAAAAGQAEEATQALAAAGAAPAAAEQLVALLTRPHIVTMIHVVRPIGDDAAIQSITTLHNDDTLFVAVSPEGDEGPMVIQTVGLEALTESVARMLTIPLGE